ncbi:L-histidine N(alpha)-methyltransferase [Flavobacteriales bacterium]|nr:L-histidine N(alpha)-methyltransferase [Flavobacteriales bacterium]
MTKQFKNDVNIGLSSSPKFLSSKYFYDKIGDELFVEIMNIPEYYLTRAEFEIFNKKTSDLIDSFEIDENEKFQLLELGAGDGTKTKELLKVLVSQGYDFEYVPIDISQNTLDKLESSLEKEIPTLSVTQKQGDYFEVLSSFKEVKTRKIVLFLGSNIGNLTDELSSKFLYELGGNLNENDRLLLGVDLIKPVDIVLPAYNDKQGITAKFNLNLLTRINSELSANFNLSNFKHQPEYTIEEGIAKSFIVSTEKQTVEIKSIKKTFSFDKEERIHTEISRKYNDSIINKIIENTDFTIENKILDSKEYFADYILKKN